MKIELVVFGLACVGVGCYTLASRAVIGKLFLDLFGPLVKLTGAGPGRSGKYYGLIPYGLLLIVIGMLAAITGVEPGEFEDA